MVARLEDIINFDDIDLMKMIKHISYTPFSTPDKFVVYTLETSRGKTVGTAYAISKAIKEGRRTKYIFTTKTKKECSRVAEVINKEVGKDVAICFRPGSETEEINCSNDFYECAKYQVLIITHATYLNLCSPKTKLHKDYSNYVKEHFDYLIIDEELNAVVSTICVFDENIYEKIKKLIKDTNSQGILNLFDRLCEKPRELIKFYKEKEVTNRIIVAENLTEKSGDRTLDLINEIDNVIKSFSEEEYTELLDLVYLVDDEIFNDHNLDNNLNIKKAEIIKTIYRIYMLCNNIIHNKVLYWNETLYSCDFDFKFLMLKNNIMLDASADFNTLYDNKLFEVIKSERTINHENCSLHWHKMNTSKSAKKGTGQEDKLTNFRYFIAEDIKSQSKQGDEIVIITNKAECMALEKRFIDENFNKYFKNYVLLNFFNMRGVDTYGKYNNCFIIHTHRFAFPIYALIYMYYAYIDDAYDLDLTYGKFRGDNSISFKDKIIDGLLFTDEVSAVYQACKRVCRNREPAGNFHIYNNDFEIVKVVSKQLHNVNVVPNPDNKMKAVENFYFLVKEIRDGAYDDYKLDDRKGKKIKAITTRKGKYKIVNKKLLYKLLNTNGNHFSRDIIKQVDEKELRIKFNRDCVKIYA